MPIASHGFAKSAVCPPGGQDPGSGESTTTRFVTGFITHHEEDPEKGVALVRTFQFALCEAHDDAWITYQTGLVVVSFDCAQAEELLTRAKFEKALGDGAQGVGIVNPPRFEASVPRSQNQ